MKHEVTSKKLSCARSTKKILYILCGLEIQYVSYILYTHIIVHYYNIINKRKYLCYVCEISSIYLKLFMRTKFIFMFCFENQYQ